MSASAQANTGRRSDAEALAANLPAQTPTGVRSSKGEVLGVLRHLGQNPSPESDFEPLPELPQGRFSADLRSGYGDEAERLAYAIGDSRRRAQIDVAAHGADSAQVWEMAQKRAEAKTQTDVSRLTFPDGDVDAIVNSLYLGPVSPEAVRTYVSTLNETEEGRESLKRIWTENRIRELAGDNYRLEQSFVAEAISADAAALVADWHRMMQDTFGGTARAAYNLAGDFLFGGALGTSISGAIGTNEAFLFNSNPFEITRENVPGAFPYGPLEENYNRSRNWGPIQEALTPESRQEAYDALSAATYRSGAQAGSGVYMFGSDVFRGAGSVVPFLAVPGGQAYRYAFSVGVGRQEAHETLRSLGVTENTETIAFVAGLISGALELVGLERILKAWRSAAPLGQAAREVAGAAAGEGVTEFLQSMTSYTAGEIGLFLQGEEAFTADRAKTAVKDAAYEGLVGSIVGGGASGIGSSPVRTFARHIDYRNYQTAITGGIERLKQAPDLKTNPQVMDAVLRESAAKAGLPESGYINAESFVRFFQGDEARLNRAMEKLDITPAQLEAARAADAQVEIDSVSMIEFEAANQDSANLHEWVQPTPDAPTIGVLLEETRMEAEAAAEYLRLHEANEPLPGPFQEFRQQLIDEASYDAEGAQYVADVLYALANTAGSRMGLTPEQYLNLNPIKVILANQVARARNMGEAVETAASDQEMYAAQSAYTRSQQERKGKAEFIPSPSGTIDYGVLDPSRAAGGAEAGLAAAPIRLERGTREWGRNHMRKRSRDIVAEVDEIAAALRQWETENPGYTNAQRDDFVVESFVYYMSQNYDTVQKGHSDRVILVKQGKGNSRLILQMKENGPGDFYSAVTAVIRKERGRANRDGGVDQRLHSSDAPLISESRPGETGEDGNIRIRGQFASPLTTIQSESGEVKSSGNLPDVQQAGAVSGEQLRERRTTLPSESGARNLLQSGITQGRNDAAYGPEGQRGSPEFTIPVEGADVKQWAAESAETLLAELAVPPEQAAGLKQYLAQALEEGIDPAVLANERQTASAVAEAYNQAVQGLERILSSEEGVTQAVLDALGIEEGGTADIQERISRLSAEAESFRNFYADPRTLRAVRNMASAAAETSLRGDVTITPDLNIIRVFRGKQDRSTILHELFHIFNGRFIEAAQAENAPAQLRQDFDTLNEAVGGGLESADADIRRRAEERAADRFEQYLAEGKAPSPGLADAFRRFRTWLSTIYRQLAGMGETDLAPEVRGVFDRMLASEAETAQARQFYHDVDVLSPPADASPEQAEALAEGAQTARLTAEERQFRKVLKEYLDLEGGRMDIRRRAREEVAALPQYRAIREMRRAGGIPREIAEAAVGAETARRISDTHGRIIRSDGGINALQVNEIVSAAGYESAADMLSEISQVTSYRRAVSDLSQRMIADAEAFVRQAVQQEGASAADDAYHNPDLSRVLEAKQAVLDRQAQAQADAEGRRTQRRLNNAALRRIAQDVVANSKTRKGTNYRSAIEAYRRHAEAAARADAAGDKVTAANEFQKMRLNHYLIREGIQARKDVDKFALDNTSYRKWIRRLEGNGRASAPVEEAYREAVRDMLTTWKVVPDARMRPQNPVGDTIAVPQVDAELNPDLAAFAPPLAEYVAPWITDRSGADQITSWRDLTVEQVRQLSDALDIVTKQGRGVLKGLKLEGIQTRQEAKAAILNSLNAQPKYKGPDDRTFAHRAVNFLSDFFISNLQASQYAKTIDGNPTVSGRETGVLEQMINSIRDGQKYQWDMLRTFRQDSAADYRVLDGMAERLAKLFNSKTFALEWFPVPGLIQDRRFRKTWDADMIRAVFLNMGNASNLETLKAGLGITQAQLDRLASLATEAEWRAVQNLGNRIGGLYDAIDAVYYRQTNKHLEKVVPTPLTVTTSEGTTITLDGWYYPKKYDPVTATKAAKFTEIDDFRAIMQGVFTRNTLEKGFTNARQENVQLPMLLDTRVLVDHVLAATRFASSAEALLEFEAITTDPDVRDAIIDKHGQILYGQLRKWAANQVKPDKGGQSSVDKFFGYLRNASTLSALGLNLRSAFRQTESFGIAADLMSNGSRTGASGWHYLQQGAKKMGVSGFTYGFAGMQSDAILEMREKSGEARGRDGSINKDIRELTRGADPTRIPSLKIGNLEVSRDMFFHFTFAMDQGVAGTCWWGAYFQAAAGDANFSIEGLSPKEIDAKAIQWADTILRSQQSPYDADVTNFQRDKGIQSLFTQFLSGVTPYLSHTAGMVQAWQRGDKSAVDLMRHLINVYAMPAFGYTVVPALLKKAIYAASGWDDPDDESLAAKFGWGLAENLTAPLPIVRNLVGAAKYGPNSAIPPAFSIPGRTVSSGWRGVKKLSDGEIVDAGSELGKSLRIIFPVHNPLRNIQQAGEVLGITGEE